jgi:ketosteroid isomerase-like protein
MRILIVATTLLLLSSALDLQDLAGQVASDEAAVETVHAFHAALAAGDSATALSLLAPDVVIFESGAVEASRDEYRSHHLPADMEFSQSVSREITSERSGSAGDVAWMLTESHSTGTFRERPIDVRGIETMLLRRTADGWRIVHIHWSSRRVRADSGS